MADSEQPSPAELDNLKISLGKIRHEISALRHSKTHEHQPVHERKRLEDDPLITSRQHELYWYWEMTGVIGLCYWLEQIAQYERGFERAKGIGVSKRPRNADGDGYDDPPGGHVSWSRLVDDFARGENSRSLYYLSSVPSEIMAGLLRGDLPSKMQNPDFKAKWGEYLECTRSQGTYIVQIVRKVARCTSRDQANCGPAEESEDRVCETQLPDGNTGIGWGFTWKELIFLTEKVKLYADVQNQTSADWAQLVDNHGESSCPELDYQWQRRYAGGQHRNLVEPLANWAATIEYTWLHYAKKLEATRDEYLLHRPMQRCLSYGGLSHNVRDRTDANCNPGSSGTRLLSLIMAICELHWKDLFDVRNYTFPVFRTVEVDDIGLDEILSCLLTSCNNRDGGLNLTWAGASTGARVARENPKYQEELYKNAERIGTSGVQAETIRESCEKITKLKEKMKIAEEAEKEREDLEKALDNDLQEIRELEDEIEQLQRQQQLKLYHDLRSLMVELDAQDLLDDRQNAWF
jgi:hypothetical protein